MENIPLDESQSGSIGRVMGSEEVDMKESPLPAVPDSHATEEERYQSRPSDSPCPPIHYVPVDSGPDYDSERCQTKDTQGCRPSRWCPWRGRTLAIRVAILSGLLLIFGAVLVLILHFT